MKIEARCDVCRRTFLLSQIGPDSDSPGRCPFCGTRFGPHYSSLLIDTVTEAERVAGRFVSVMAMLQSMETGFDIDVDGLLADLSEQVRRHEQPAAS